MFQSQDPCYITCTHQLEKSITKKMTATVLVVSLKAVGNAPNATVARVEHQWILADWLLSFLSELYKLLKRQVKRAASAVMRTARSW